jgi:hypothetical protein
MDLDAIRQGLERLVGKHDFRNFCKMDVEKVYNFERVIHSAELVEVLGDKEVFYLQILGQAFLWHQIRCIAQVIFMVGKGLEPASVVSELLDVSTHPRKPSYQLADEKPLVLHDCGYPNLQVGYSVQNLWTVSWQLEQQWEEQMLAAARVRNCIESFKNFSVLKEDLLDFLHSKLSERSRKLHRKEQYHYGKIDQNDINKETLEAELSELTNSNEPATVNWEQALAFLRKHSLIPDSGGLDTTVHTPLMHRSMGPTYEEKVESVKNSDKRRKKFEENVIKKRKTAEEDAAFYNHMTKQGGTSM